MSTPVSDNGLSRITDVTGAAAKATLVLMARAAALIIFVLMSLAEPVFAAVLSSLAIGCFFVSVLFGFIFHAPFQHRWFVLGASVVFMLMYFLYRFVMLGVERLFR